MRIEGGGVDGWLPELVERSLLGSTEILGRSILGGRAGGVETILVKISE
jgi:hypothetical protein